MDWLGSVIPLILMLTANVNIKLFDQKCVLRIIKYLEYIGVLVVAKS